jgi:hypothetical protein
MIHRSAGLGVFIKSYMMHKHWSFSPKNASSVFMAEAEALFLQEEL